MAADGSFAFQHDDLAPSQRQRPADRKPDDARADHDRVEFLRRSKAFSQTILGHPGMRAS